MKEIYKEKITCPVCGAEYDEEIDTSDVPFAEYECDCGAIFCITRATVDTYHCFIDEDEE